MGRQRGSLQRLKPKTTEILSVHPAWLCLRPQDGCILEENGGKKPPAARFRSAAHGWQWRVDGWPCTHINNNNHAELLCVCVCGCAAVAHTHTHTHKTKVLLSESVCITSSINDDCCFFLFFFVFFFFLILWPRI